MLLEIRSVSDSLAATCIAVNSRDDHLVGYAKNEPLYRVGLTHAGRIQSIELIDKERLADLLKYRLSTGGTQPCTPGFNIPPLFDVSNSERTDFEKDVATLLTHANKGDDAGLLSAKTCLEGLIARCHLGWTTQKQKVIQDHLAKASDALLKILNAASDCEQINVTPLLALLQRVILLKPEALRDDLIRVATNGVIGGQGDKAFRKGLAQLLFNRQGKKVGIMFELADTSGPLANHPSVWKAVNKILLQCSSSHARETTKSTAGDELLDLFGDECQSPATKLPRLTLPKLGNVILRSHAASKKCQVRYGLIEGLSCPVSLDNRASLANSLSWLTAPEREGKTYCDISQANGFSFPALMLIFPDPLPPEPAAYAEMFADSPEEDQSVSQEGRFIAATESVTTQLETPTGEMSDAVIKVFAIGKRDSARTKLLLSKQYSALQIVESARDWRKASVENVPPIFLWQFGIDKRPGWVKCNRIPTPSQMGRCLNLTWHREKTDLRQSSLCVFDFGSELTLFLEVGPTLFTAATRALRLAVQQWLHFLLRIGQDTAIGRPYSRWPKEQLLLPSILGLLLAKLGSLKETYMNDVPYWIGRLLAVADQFHLNYCRIERKGEIPSGPLIGNATMATALENPQAGLARLAERISLYQRVADEKLRRESAEITSHIDPTKISDRATDEQKAQMLLGYLARPDLLENSPTNAS